MNHNTDMSSNHETMTRRGFLRAALAGAGVLTGAAVLAACGGGAAPVSSAPASSAPASSKPAAASSAPPSSAPASSAPAASSASAASSAAATGPVKIGLIVPSSGPATVLGQGMSNGFRQYMDEVGNKAGGRPIQITQEDETSDAKNALDKAKKLVEQDKVDLLAGLVYTPSLYAIRDYLENTAPRKVVLVVTNAGGSDLDGKLKSDLIARTSFSNAQNTAPMGPYLYGIGKRKAFITGLDYAAGHEKLDPFKKTFVQAGGQIVGEAYAPIGTTDFGAYITKIANSGADVVFAFYSGAEALAYVKAFASFGLNKKMLSSGDGGVNESAVLAAEGDNALGITTALNWYSGIDTPENKKWMADYKAKYKKDGDQPAIDSYDGARLIVDALNKTNGDTTTAKVIQAMKGMKWTSPRGPMQISPDNNDIIQNIYVAETQKVNGVLTNVIVKTLEKVDPATYATGKW